MTLFPGAIWRPIPVSSSRPRRGKGRGVVFHVAVSEGASLFNIFSTSGNDSHLYVRKDGAVEQYIDLELVAYASMAANANTISVETQGGVTNPDGEPWTAAQVATLARIARWAHDTEGVPLSLMPNSLPTSKGIGYHRLGIDPWRVAGGEVWSSSRGKLCPGAAKITQIPQIIQLALNGDDMPTADEVAAAVWNYGIQHSDAALGGPAPAWMWLRNAREAQVGYGARIERIDEGATGGKPSPWGYGVRIEDVQARVVALQAALAAVVAAGTSGLSKDDLKAAIAEALKENTVTVDVEVNGKPAPTP